MGLSDISVLGLLLLGISNLFIGCNAANETIRVVSILTPTYLQLKGNGSSNSNETADPSTQEYEGLISSILEGMAEIIGREIKIEVLTDSYGRKEESGAWTGMVGVVADGGAALAAAPLTVTLAREEVVDFLYPFQTHEASILMRRRHPAQEPVIESLQDLVSQEEVQYGVMRDGAIARFIESSKDELLQMMWANMTANPRVFKDSNQLGVDRAREDHTYAFILEGSLAEQAVSKPPCDLEVIKAGFYNRQYAFAVTNQSPLRDELNRALTILKHNGKMDAYFQQWFGDDECSAAVNVRLPWVTLALAAAILFWL